MSNKHYRDEAENGGNDENGARVTKKVKNSATPPAEEDDVGEGEVDQFEVDENGETLESLISKGKYFTIDEVDTTTSFRFGSNGGVLQRFKNVSESGDLSDDPKTCHGDGQMLMDHHPMNSESSGSDSVKLSHPQ
jgi:hypothetical protein